MIYLAISLLLGVILLKILNEIFSVKGKKK